jgi:hypothetical protein
LILERITEKPFPKIRPNWLQSESGKRLELDGYNKELGVAFEYNGIQHYEENKFFHNTENSFSKRKLDDLQKINLCHENNVYLIVVKYDIPKDRIFQFVLSKLDGLPDAKKIIKNRDEFDFRDLNIWKRNEIVDLRQIAQSKGGICLSDAYLGNNVKLKWQCNKGHLWEAAPRDIKSGNWCPACSGRDKQENYRIILEKVKEKGGRCISDKYTDAQTKLLLECENGHQWLSNFTSIKKGTWCQKCKHNHYRHKNNKYTLSTFQEIAIEKNGKCLSQEYKNTDSRLLFQCKEGHEWTATAWTILKGSWCRKCVQQKPR